MKKMLVFLLIGFSVIGSSQASPQKLVVTGRASDVHSKADISGVSFFAINENRRKLLTATDAQGKFSFEVASEMQQIVVEKAGYRTIHTRVSSYRNAGRKTDFFVSIPLIPLDRQAQDAPYMQSEQTQYTLEGEAKRKKAIVRKFLVSDAVSGTPVKLGTLCFEFTRDGKKECKDLEKEPVMSFSQADIVGFTVTAEGYQPYTGNLILDKMDEAAGKYSITLTPEVTMLSLNVYNNTNVAMCRLSNEKQGDILMASAGNNAYFSMVRDGSYKLTLFDRKKAPLYTEWLVLGKGLNFLGMNVPATRGIVSDAEKEKPLAAVPQQVAGLDSLQMITVYFNQGNYNFNQSEKNKLNALADWLRTNPGQKVRIVGHTDNVGDPKLNIALSENRARVIRYYLVARKVNEQQIIWTGVGGKYPARKNDTEENKKMNRRVEISMIQ